MKKSMLEAFIEQTYGDRDGIVKAEQEADRRALEDKNRALDYQQRAINLLSRSQYISDHIDIPSQKPIIKNDNSGTVSHFKGYDHSLDRSRIKFKKQDGDVEWGDMHDPDVGEWEIK